MTIRPMTPEDWPSIRRIYEEGIATGDATFETSAPSWQEWDAGHLAIGRLVAEVDDDIAGWAALSGVSDRCAYAGVAEVSVYVASSARGHGIGSQLLQALIAASEDGGIWTLQAGIFPENTASLAIHARSGFREIGRRERLGQLRGRWRDTLLLERRSRRVGVESRQ
jgi:L-amino acid N-acyltransferase YncA